MSQDHQTPHVDYCRREGEIIALGLDMKVVKQSITSIQSDVSAMKHALMGNIETPDKSGLLEQHKEHRHTLFGRHDGDRGLVGQVEWITAKMQETKSFARGVSAAFGVIGAGLAWIGFEGVRWLISRDK
jgi:hypothetical protein